MSAISDVRNLFPGPDKCVTGAEQLSIYLGKAAWTKGPCTSSCSYVKQAIFDMNRAISDWHQPRGETAYVDAYNTVIGEYQAYYNSKCAVAAPVPIASATPIVTVPIQTDPVTGDTVVPPAAGTATPATPTPAAAPTTLGDKLKAVPKAVWYVGGGLLLGTVIFIIVKTRKP